MQLDTSMADIVVITNQPVFKIDIEAPTLRRISSNENTPELESAYLYTLAKNLRGYHGKLEKVTLEDLIPELENTEENTKGVLYFIPDYSDTSYYYKYVPELSDVYNAWKSVPARDVDNINHVNNKDLFILDVESVSYRFKTQILVPEEIGITTLTGNERNWNFQPSIHIKSSDKFLRLGPGDLNVYRDKKFNAEATSAARQRAKRAKLTWMEAQLETLHWLVENTAEYPILCYWGDGDLDRGALKDVIVFKDVKCGTCQKQGIFIDMYNNAYCAFHAKKCKLNIRACCYYGTFNVARGYGSISLRNAIQDHLHEPPEMSKLHGALYDAIKTKELLLKWRDFTKVRILYDENRQRKFRNGLYNTGIGLLSYRYGDFLFRNLDSVLDIGSGRPDKFVHNHPKIDILHGSDWRESTLTAKHHIFLHSSYYLQDCLTKGNPEYIILLEHANPESYDKSNICYLGKTIYQHPAPQSRKHIIQHGYIEVPFLPVINCKYDREEYFCTQPLDNVNCAKLIGTQQNKTFCYEVCSRHKEFLSIMNTHNAIDIRNELQFSCFQKTSETKLENCDKLMLHKIVMGLDVIDIINQGIRNKGEFILTTPEIFNYLHYRYPACDATIYHIAITSNIQDFDNICIGGHVIYLGDDIDNLKNFGVIHVVGKDCIVGYNHYSNYRPKLEPNVYLTPTHTSYRASRDYRKIRNCSDFEIRGMLRERLFLHCITPADATRYKILRDEVIKEWEHGRHMPFIKY